MRQIDCQCSNRRVKVNLASVLAPGAADRLARAYELVLRGGLLPAADGHETDQPARTSVRVEPLSTGRQKHEEGTG